MLPQAHEIDGGEFCAQLKPPPRVRDLTTGELQYRWTETKALDHDHKHAQAFDHLPAFHWGGLPEVTVM